jgi:hypothetical protein
LSVEEGRRVAGHLEICAACRQEEARYRRSLALLRAAPRVPCPDDLHSAFTARLRRCNTRAYRVQRSLRWAMGAACLLLITGASASFLNVQFQFWKIANLAEKPLPKVTPSPVAPPVISHPASPVRKEGQVPPVVPLEGDPPASTSGNIAANRIAPAPVVEPTNRAQPPRRVALPRRRPAAQRPSAFSSFLDVKALDGKSALDRIREAQDADLRRAPLTPSSSSESEREEGERLQRLKALHTRNKPVIIVPSLDEQVRVGDTVTQMRGEAGWDARGQLSMIRIKTNTTRLPAEAGESK